MKKKIRVCAGETQEVLHVGFQNVYTLLMIIKKT